MSSNRFSAASALTLFETDETFRDSHMAISCILRRFQNKIKALILVESSASGYSFIDQDFARFITSPYTN